MAKSKSSSTTQRNGSLISRACDRCKIKRNKCDGYQPCAPCRRLELPCVYHISDKRRQRTRHDEVEALQARIRELEEYVMRSSESSSSDSACTPVKEKPSPLLPPLSKVISNLCELSIPDASLAIYAHDVNARPVDQQAQILPAFTYGLAYLPPRDVVVRGAECFFQVIIGMCHVMTVDEFRAVVDKVYSSAGGDLLDLIEICAIAAIGSPYLDTSNPVPDNIKDALFHSAFQHINLVLEERSARSIRVLACLCMYGLIEKRRSTRELLQHTLRLCRWLVHSVPDGRISPDHIKLYRGVIFLECWLATSLGYCSDLSDEEVQHVLTMSKLRPDCTLHDKTQLRMTEIGLLKINILREVYRTKTTSVEMIEKHMRILGHWHESVPSEIKLLDIMAGLGSSRGISECGALVLGHVMYHGAIVFLHHRGLVADLRTVSSQHSTEDTLPTNIKSLYRQRSVEAARATGQIFALVGFATRNSPFHIRCWLSCYEIFMSIVVLLSEAAICLATHENEATVDEDMAQAGNLLDKLKTAAAADLVTSKLYSTISPIHDSLTQAKTPAQTVYEPLRRGRKEEAGRPNRCAMARHSAQRLVHVLQNPFGHLQGGEPELLHRASSAQYPDWWESSTWRNVPEKA